MPCSFLRVPITFFLPAHTCTCSTLLFLIPCYMRKFVCWAFVLLRLRSSLTLVHYACRTCWCLRPTPLPLPTLRWLTFPRLHWTLPAVREPSGAVPGRRSIPFSVFYLHCSVFSLELSRAAGSCLPCDGLDALLLHGSVTLGSGRRGNYRACSRTTCGTLPVTLRSAGACLRVLRVRAAFVLVVALPTPYCYITRRRRANISCKQACWPCTAGTAVLVLFYHQAGLIRRGAWLNRYGSTRAFRTFERKGRKAVGFAVRRDAAALLGSLVTAVRWRITPPSSIHHKHYQRQHRAMLWRWTRIPLFSKSPYIHAACVRCATYENLRLRSAAVGASWLRWRT